MKADFNTIRKRLIDSYNAIYEISKAIPEDAKPYDYDWKLDNLRDCVVTIACLESKLEGFTALNVGILPMPEEGDDEDDEF